MKIGIVGLGLMGGSIFKALNRIGREFELYVVTRNEKTLKEVSPQCEAASSDFLILKNCDMVFVCTPMSNTIETLEKLEAYLPETTIVTDVCSLKNFVMEKEYSFSFIGSHPMAGTENTGYENSFDEMFEGAKWVLTPYETTSAENLLQLESVIKKMGAKVVYAEPNEHDEAVAKISHMPMLLAQALFDMAQGDELAMELASSGFRDMTRLAMSNIDMANDMMTMNEKNISKALLALQESLVGLKTNYKERISDISLERRYMYDKDGKNVK